MPGFSQPLNWKPNDKGLAIQVPEMGVGRSPCGNAWVVKLTGLKATGGP